VATGLIRYTCECKFCITKIIIYICEKIGKMEAKLRQLMKHEGINSSRLAEILGIQASGISHIMSGRNKPSYDFLLKLLQRFPQINPDWLLLDKGPMYRDEIKNKSGAPTSGGRGGGGTNSATVSGIGGAAGGGTNGATSGGSVSAHGGSFSATGGTIGAQVGGFPSTGGGSVGAQGGGLPMTGGVARGVDGGGFSASDGRDGGGSVGAQAEGFSASGGRGTNGAMNGAAGGGLFGPDNDDIIRGGAQSGFGSGGGGQINTPTDRENSREVYAASPQRVSGVPQTPPQSGQIVAEQPIYQTGSLKRTAAIERIVVFYRDKTFSEYQPE
jgi:hypothetical protein